MISFLFIEFAFFKLYTTLLNCLSVVFFLLFHFVDEANLGWKCEREGKKFAAIKKIVNCTKHELPILIHLVLSRALIEILSLSLLC